MPQSTILTALLLILLAPMLAAGEPESLTQEAFGPLIVKKTLGGVDPRFRDPPKVIANRESLISFMSLLETGNGMISGMDTKRDIASKDKLELFMVGQPDGSHRTLCYRLEHDRYVLLDEWTIGKDGGLATFAYTTDRELVYLRPQGAELRRVAIPPGAKR